MHGNLTPRIASGSDPLSSASTHRSGYIRTWAHAWGTPVTCPMVWDTKPCDQEVPGYCTTDRRRCIGHSSANPGTLTGTTSPSRLCSSLTATELYQRKCIGPKTGMLHFHHVSILMRAHAHYLLAGKPTLWLMIARTRCSLNMTIPGGRASEPKGMPACARASLF